jgi:hypothetical protein
MGACPPSILHVSPRAIAWRSAATFIGLASVVYGITMFAGVIQTTAETGCTWPADSGEPLPPCPPGVVPTVYISLAAGILGLIAYVKWGLRVGPRLAFLVWTAFHAWWVIPAVAEAARNDGIWSGLLGSLEAFLFLLWPLGFLFSKDFRRNAFWSDGQDFFPDMENPPPPSPPVNPWLKVWSLGMQLVAIGFGLAAGLYVFRTLPEMVPAAAG